MASVFGNVCLELRGGSLILFNVSFFNMDTLVLSYLLELGALLRHNFEIIRNFFIRFHSFVSTSVDFLHFNI
jgi:hypothetical protein